MLKIRLRRIGAKGRPNYRLVVAEDSDPRDGRFIEVLGYYNPLPDPIELTVNQERVDYWHSKGAQFTESAERVIAIYKRTQSGEAAAQS